MKTIHISLLVLIIVGVVLLATQKIWVTRLVDKVVLRQRSSNTPESTSNKKIYSPTGEYYAVENYIKSEWVSCCGSEEPNDEKKYYSVVVYDKNNNLIREFVEFNIGNYQGYTPSINKWYSDDVLQMWGSGIVDAFDIFYDISEDKLIPDWEFKPEDSSNTVH